MICFQSMVWLVKPREGGLKYQGKWECAALMGRFLYEILKHGSCFYGEKILKQWGPYSQTMFKLNTD